MSHCWFAWKFYLWCSFQTRYKHFKCNETEQNEKCALYVCVCVWCVCLWQAKDRYYYAHFTIMMKSFTHIEIQCAHTKHHQTNENTSHEAIIKQKESEKTQSKITNATNCQSVQRKHTRKTTFIYYICVQTISETAVARAVDFLFTLHYFMTSYAHSLAWLVAYSKLACYLLLSFLQMSTINCQYSR